MARLKNTVGVGIGKAAIRLGADCGFGIMTGYFVSKSGLLNNKNVFVRMALFTSIFVSGLIVDKEVGKVVDGAVDDICDSIDALRAHKRQSEVEDGKETE